MKLSVPDTGFISRIRIKFKFYAILVILLCLMRLSIKLFVLQLIFIPSYSFHLHRCIVNRSSPMKTLKSYFKSTSTVSSASSLAENEEPSSKRLKSTEDNEIASESVSEISPSTIVEPIEATKHIPISDEWIQLSYMAEDWKSRLQPEFNKPYFKKLQTFVDSERKSHTIYPPLHETFTAFNLCPFDNIRVVIIGQDPYHGPNQAHGLAFSVKQDVKNPPSLQNIFNEAQADVGIRKPRHGNLENWSKQGVFLLNTALTVRKGEANSHQKKGWELFTDAVVREIGKKENVVYLLWGNPAATKCAGIDRTKNMIISTSHPSPLGAYKTDKPFMGSKCFSRCNDALIAYGKEPIDWNVS